MAAFISLVFILALTLVGDYCIKLSSQQEAGLKSGLFLIGAAFYALPAVGWFFLMRSHSLATVGVIYSSATIVLLALMGAVVFRETLGLRDGIGIALALASVIVMTQE